MGLIEQLKALDEQREKLIEDAKKAALERAHKAIAELNELGLDYRLLQGSSRAAAKPAAKPASGGLQRQRKDAPCPICHFRTRPPHDARSHRGQEPKKPFTAAELAAKGYSAV